MARTTKADLEQLCRIIARHTDDDGWYVEYAYGRPRLLLETDTETGAAREVSPRLAVGADGGAIWATAEFRHHTDFAVGNSG